MSTEKPAISLSGSLAAKRYSILLNTANDGNNLSDSENAAVIIRWLSKDY